jgi:hypothetical protein
MEVAIMMRSTVAAVTAGLLTLSGCSTGGDTGAAAGASGTYGAGNNLPEKRSDVRPGLGSGYDATLPGNTQSSVR